MSKKNYNSKELKECIATAKAVREAAIANAKAVLEEEFASKFTESLASKLKEDISAEEEETIETNPETGEVDATVQDTETETAPTAPAEGIVVQANDATTGEPLPVNGQTPDETKAAAEQAGVAVAEPTGEAQTPDADTEGEIETGETDDEEGLPAEENPDETVEDQVEDNPELTESDVDSILKELAGEFDITESEEVTADAGKDEAQQTVKVQPAGLPDSATTTVKVTDDAKTDKDSFPVNEEISLDQMLKEIDDALGTKEKEEIEIEEPVDECGKACKNECNVTDKELAEALVNAYKVARENEARIAEYENVITEMKKALNESKLFNSKLVFINKLFKNNKSLNEAQRNLIYKAFESAKTDREVSLAYALLQENFRSNTASVIKPVKKTNLAKSVVSSLTEGLASKPIASTKPSASIINEVDTKLQNRLRELAGIGFLNQ